MRYLKMFGLVAALAAALTAIVGTGSASATVLCSTTADPCPVGQDWSVNTAVDFSIPAGQSALLNRTDGSNLDTCTGSTIKGKITNTGSGTETNTELVEEVKWTNCSFPTSTSIVGNMEIHKIAGTSNGTATVDGTTETEINTVLFGVCKYKFTPGTSLGDITEGNPAIFHMNAVAERYTGDPFACPPTVVWTATYTLTSPSGTTLSVSNSSN